jgi:Flagellar Assembly Protein A/PilZ domain
MSLSSDAMQLDVCLTSDALNMSHAALLNLMHEQCARLGLAIFPTRLHLEMVLSKGIAGSWMTLLKGASPSAPVDGRVELLVPIPVAAARVEMTGHRCIVRAGAGLARKVPGKAGTPGRDLFGRKVLARRPYEPRLPKGANTDVAIDGMELVANCDGEVLLRNLLIEIVPMHVHTGDISAGVTVKSDTLPVYIRGSVLEGATIEAREAVFVDGDVVEAQITSVTSSVIIAGKVGGTRQRKCLLRAAGAVSFDQARLSEVHAGKDIHVIGQAWQCDLHATGNLHLSGTLQDTLQDVRLRIGSGVLPLIEREQFAPSSTHLRQSVRVACTLPASLAVHDGTPLLFHPCNLMDLSVGGARCTLRDARAKPQSGAIVQLKLLFPGSPDHFLAIACVVRTKTPAVVGMRFVQLTQRDQSRLRVYVQQLILKRSSVLITSPDQRAE